MKNTFWKNKNVLITGHSGFKGSWLSLYLTSLGSNVFGLSSYKLDGVYKLADVSSIMSEELFIDISLLETSNKLIPFLDKVKPDIIFHFAAQSLVLESYRNPRKTLETNIFGTYNLIESTNNSSVNPKIVVATTDKVYKYPERFNDEKSELGGKDFYSISKVSKELIVESVLQHPNFKELNISRVRSGNVVGGGERRENRLFTDLISSLINKNDFILRNPNSIRPWQYILDSLTGYLMVAEKSYINNANLVYNLNSEINNNYDVEAIAKLFLKHSGNRNKIILENTEIYEEVDKLTINSYKANNELGWSAMMGIEEIVKLIIDWEKNYTNESGPEYSFQEIKNYLSI